VLEAACIAIPHEQWGEAPAALVVLKPGANTSEIELIEFCRQHLAHYKCPKSVSFIEQLTTDSDWQIQKGELRKYFWEVERKWSTDHCEDLSATLLNLTS